MGGFAVGKQQQSKGIIMKINLDLKSAVCGLLIGVLAMLAIGAGTSSSDTGRYQVSGGEQGCAVMVDTRTGKAWAFQAATTMQFKRDANFLGREKLVERFEAERSA
jgi:hypothetical protein